MQVRINGARLELVQGDITRRIRTPLSTRRTRACWAAAVWMAPSIAPAGRRSWQNAASWAVARRARRASRPAGGCKARYVIHAVGPVYYDGHAGRAGERWPTPTAAAWSWPRRARPALAWPSPPSAPAAMDTRSSRRRRSPCARSSSICAVTPRSSWCALCSTTRPPTRCMRKALRRWRRPEAAMQASGQESADVPGDPAHGRLTAGWLGASAA